MFPEFWSGLIGAWCPSLGQQDQLRDVSGHQRHGTINSATWTKAVVANQLTDVLTFAGAEDVTLDRTTSDLNNWFLGSMSAFASFSVGAVGPQYIVGSVHPTNDPFFIRVRQDTPAFISNIETDSGSVFATTNIAFSLNTWYSFGFVYDGAYMWNYRDGICINPSGDAQTGTINTFGGLYIGRETTNFYTGSIGNVYLWDRPLPHNLWKQLHEDPEAPLRLKD